VVAGARAGQVRVVDGRGEADGARAAREAVAQVVGHQLHLVGAQSAVVVQHRVARGAARALRDS